MDKVLNAKCKDEGVRKVIVEMLDACGEITEALRSALVTARRRRLMDHLPLARGRGDGEGVASHRHAAVRGAETPEST